MTSAPSDSASLRLSADDAVPIPGGASTPEEVVREAIEQLPSGPTWFVGAQTRQQMEMLRAMPRNEAVRMVAQHTGVMDGNAESSG